MESPAAAQVNAAAVPPALMMTIGQIAERDGVTSAAVSRSVKRLATKRGLQVTRDGEGRVTGVNVAHFDTLKGKHGDPAHAQAPRKATTRPAKDPTYEDARARQALYDGELSRIKLAKEIGELVWRADVEHAMTAAGLQIGNAIDQIAGEVDELAAAYTAGGLQGLRVKLKDLVHKARNDVADVLQATAAAAPETSPAPEGSQ